MQTIELRDYILPLQRWWWLVLASTLLAAFSSLALSMTQPDRYQSRATVMVGAGIQDPNPDSMQFFMSQQLATTYADLAQRPTVQEATMNALGLSWLPAYVVSTVPNTQLMEVVVTDTDPARAKAVVDELVNQLILRSPAGREEQARQDFVSQELTEMEQAIRATKDEVSQRQNELGNLFSARQIADAQSQIFALQDKLNSLQANYATLLATTQRGAVNTINIVEPANLPGGPLGSNIMWNVLLAAAVGLMLGAGGAYLIEYLDDSIKNSNSVERDLGSTTLGAIPEFGADDKTNELVMLGRSQSPGAEAYRILRTNLQFAAVAHELNRLLVTSASPGEGKSTTAGNLAVAIAQAGRRVVLIDADLHRPRQHRVFKLVNNVGVTSALLSDPTNVEMFLQRTPIASLRVLTTGPLPPNPAELLGSQRMRDLLNTLQQHADVIIIDSPPTTAVADTAVLSTLVDGVLLVVETGKTGREPAKRALAALHQVQAHVVGVVLNRMPTRGSGYYYYHYNYHRKYYRRDDVVDATAQPIPQQPATVNPLARGRHQDGGQLNGGANGADVKPAAAPDRSRQK